MSASVQSPRGARVPWGLLGMIALVLAAEGHVARRALDFTGAAAAYFAYPARALPEAKSAQVLCLGDSLVKVGLAPRVIEARLARPAYNLAVPGATPPITYLTLRHALDAGARPSALVVDFDDSNLWADPRLQARGLTEVVDLRDCVELARAWGDASLFGRLVAARLFPTIRDRAEIRASIVGALAGRSTSERAAIVANERNYRANRGALILPKSWERKGATEFWDEAAHLQADWHCDPRCGVFLIKFLKLAAAREIPVFWLLPPLRPSVQAKRDRLGLDETFDRFVGKALARFPNLRIIDARRSGFGEDSFVDAGHLNREGARALSADVAEALAGGPKGPRWVALAGTGLVGADEAPLEDLDQTALAASRLPEGRR